MSDVYPEWLADAMQSPVMSESSCSCDPSVGVVKCESCVISTAIRHARTLCELVRKQIELHLDKPGNYGPDTQQLWRLVRPPRAPRTHELKSWPEYFQAVARGDKKFEGRSDKDFAVNDFLHLREWCPKLNRYTGNECMACITFKLEGGQFGIDEGWCVLSINVLDVGFNVREQPRAPGAAARDPFQGEVIDG